MPLQGVDFLGNRTRRDAAGWYVLPFQGEGLTGNPNGRVENITLKRQTLPADLSSNVPNVPTQKFRDNKD
ncbi:MAG: hypothetical protein LBG58_11975 [Planctomycetaceae bacterium]|nr:hypothetical protein [Planctomycetaceae bacterium]